MSGVHPAVERWFERRGFTVLPFQRAAWAAYADGHSGLVHSPTGSGKSLAAWLGPVQQWLAREEAAAGPPGLRVLWLTPMRALANDTAHNLAEAVEALGVPWPVEVRTGDTGQTTRARQRKTPPAALVTTPESLSVMLSYADGGRLFRQLECVVVDEWHELLGSKRGVQLELGLARLRRLAPGLRTWGLSATLGNLDEAMAALMGPGRDGVLVRGEVPKAVSIEALVPATIERFPWAGHLGLGQIAAVVEAIEGAATTLVFTNTRSQAELWHQALLQARPDWAGVVALHHGSLDRELRAGIESGLRSGALRAVVCTSSLDLGVDFSPVEQVLQIGSPKGVARLVQRAGRSGHRPGATSAVLCVPTHAFELVEIAAARCAHAAGRIEARRPLRRCLDVLAQHVVTLALGGGFRHDELLEEVRTTHAFSELGDEEWRWVLDFVGRGGPALQAYPQYRRVVERDGVCRVEDARIGRLHRMSIGTITSDTAMQVRWLKGGRIGTIEESFVSRLKPGDRFLYSGRIVELVRVRDMIAYVRKRTGATKVVPRWQGGRMPLSTELADTVLELFAAWRDGEPSSREMAAIGDIVALQARWSRVPVPGELLVERLKSREGHHLFVYPFAGRLVHEGLATLLAHRLAARRPSTFTLSVNDYGLELLSGEAIDTGDDLAALFDRGTLTEDLLACVNTSEIARRQFRDIARIAGLVFQGYPGAPKSTRQLQASSSLIFDVLCQYDAGNLLLTQARREVLESQLELRRLDDTLARIAEKRIVELAPERLTPLAFPLWAERLQSQVMSSESWRARVERMAGELEAAAGEVREAAGA
jgi:ATP-dependent Lhr-like helicase